MLWPNTFLLIWAMKWFTALCIKNPLLAWTDCQSSFTCHTLWTIHNAIFCSYATQKHLDSKTILGKHIIWYYNTYFNDFSKPNYLIATYHIVLKIIQLCQNKDLFYNQPSSFFILGFIKWSQKSGIYCHPKISMPRVSNLPWTLITCGRSGDLSNLVEACPLANIYQNSRSFCGGQYLSQDPSVSALLALPIMRCMCEHLEEVMNTCLLYSNSFSLSSAASSIASNINII